MHRVTLDQWYVLQTVIDTGGFTAAAEQLHRSQSSVSYAIKNLQQQLKAQVVAIEGRKVSLTPLGATLLEDVRPLLKEFNSLETKAQALVSGAPAKIKLEVDSLYPKPLLFRALKVFVEQYPHTQIELKEVIRLAPTNQVSRCDLAIGLPFNGKIMAQKLFDVELLAVAHVNHPIHRLTKTALSESDLNHYTQVYLNHNDKQASEKLELPPKRWMVNTVETAIEAVCSELCLGWLPKHRIEPLLQQQTLQPLALKVGLVRKIPLYLIYMDYDHCSPAIHSLATIIHGCAHHCESSE
ncbi:LysR family transcriptional regulator [Amphritea sp.]|uniref:LysR family transcriptional regulator n=1 Tax=Amphritea sp. TaxID=1872502 RepID=UPI003A91E3C1